MSHSPLARSTRPRRTLSSFAQQPSKLSKSTSIQDLQNHNQDQHEHNPFTPSKPSSSSRSTSPPPLLNDQATTTPQFRTTSSSIFATPTTPGINKLLTPSTYRSSLSTPSTPGDKGQAQIHLSPRIVYSPYAHSTPPAQLSKSSSIPFDLAGSARAGREAEVEFQRRGAGGEAKGKKRFVRKRSLFQRITDFPQSIIDKTLLAIPTTTQDLLPPDNYAIPLSLILNTIHFLLLAPLFGFGKENRPDSVLRSESGKSGVGRRWERWERDVGGSGLGGKWSTFSMTGLLILLASLNALYLFTRFRTYDMQLRTAQDIIPSPHASPIPAPKAGANDDPISNSDAPNTDGAGLKALKFSGRVVVLLWNFSRSALMAAVGRPVTSPPRGEGDKIQALHVWEPPEFCLAFFCAYPPTSPLLSHLLTPLHPLLTPLLLFVQSITLSHLALSFNQLVKDRMVLSAEVMREYDKRFVYKRVFGSRVDRGVGTSEAEMVW